MDYLFVYGTLLSHFDNEVLRSLKPYMQLVGAGQLKGQLYDLGEYPGYVEEPAGSDTVKGEVYQILNTELVFTILDEFEDYEYSRKEKSVWLADKNITCWVYVFIQPLSTEHQRILNGDYIAFYRNKVNNG
jgi:gamma-glutamylcyclotransferase (GGCT)/AIG2-like uncharacterized protein YtfP